ncbi:MAG TPA: hypothetical protein VF905_03075, partial [Nitrospirota bacterium]
MKKNPVLIVLLTAAVLGGIFFVVLFLTSSLSSRKTSAALSVMGTDRVAMVKIEGILISSEHVVEELNEYADDSSVKAIVIRID